LIRASKFLESGLTGAEYWTPERMVEFEASRITADPTKPYAVYPEDIARYQEEMNI